MVTLDILCNLMAVTGHCFWIESYWVAATSTDMFIIYVYIIQLYDVLMFFSFLF